MPLKVEDGTGKIDADSYFGLDVFKAWADTMGYDLEGYEDARMEGSIRRGTLYVDSNYRGRFPGYPKQGRLQSREWPRIGAYTTISGYNRMDALQYRGNADSYGIGTYQIGDSEIPREIITAVCESAYRDLKKPGVLAPDLKRGGMIQSAGAGSAQVTFASGAPAGTVFQIIETTLEPLLISVNEYSGKVTRG